MECPPISYVLTPDDVDIAYYKTGHGDPVVLLMPNPLSHLVAEWRVPALAAFYSTLARDFAIVRLDYRGSGMSRREVDEITEEVVARDIEAVMDAADFESAALWGWGFGAMNALTFASTHPDRVNRLVLSETSTGSSGLNRSIAALRNIDADVQVKTRANLNTGWTDPTNAGAIEALITAAMNERELALFWRGLIFAEQSGRSAFGVQVPTLFVHASADPIFPLAEVKQLAASIPGSRLTVLESHSSIASIQHPDAVEETKAFLKGEYPRATPKMLANPSALSTLSAREVQVLRLMASGMTNDEIARELYISASTVSHHLSHIFDKTGAGNRTEAASYAHREHLV